MFIKTAGQLKISNDISPKFLFLGSYLWYQLQTFWGNKTQSCASFVNFLALTYKESYISECVSLSLTVCLKEVLNSHCRTVYHGLVDFPDKSTAL